MIRLAVLALAALASGCGGSALAGATEIEGGAKAEIPDAMPGPDASDATVGATRDDASAEAGVDGPPVDAGVRDVAPSEAGDVPEEDAQDVGLIVVGNGSVLDGSVDFSPSDFLYLAYVTAPPTPATTTLVDLGTIAQPSQGDAGLVQLGLYSDDGGVPQALLASTPAFTLVPGRNAAEATPAVEITANTKYWVAVLALSGQNTILLYQRPAIGLPNEAIWQTQASALPSIFPVDQSLAGAGNFNLFLLVRP